MRAEIVPLEMTTPLTEALKSGGHNNGRNLPATMDSGEEVRVSATQMGGLSMVYGLDRDIIDDANQDNVTLVAGNIKLVFSVAEWRALVERMDTLIDVGRESQKRILGKEYSDA